MGSTARSAGFSAGFSAGSSAGLLCRARDLVARAGAVQDPGERFCLAHLAALRTAAAVIAERRRPAAARRRLVSVWLVLPKVAPEYADSAAYFAAGAGVRAAIEAGATSTVTRSMADDQLRAAADFLALVEDSLGMLAA